jgi:hypothetical protein
MKWFSLVMLSTLSLSSWAQPAITFVEQNWTEEQRDFFYFADQGSRLINYDLFLHLEQADNNALFRADEHMQQLGFIPTKASDVNPDGLPIGLTRNGNQMGPTCAACHTQQITYQGTRLQIDGGQAFIDLPRFLDEITNALGATLADEQKLARLQTQLHGKASEAEKAKVLALVQTEYDKRLAYQALNQAATLAGHTRLDAFGAILNQALAATGVKGNSNPLDAPTSIPYIWDTPQHDYVEWNGSQSNSGVGALARNIGEVIGVFGHVDTQPSKRFGIFDGGYDSSIQAKTLRQLEKTVATLHSPKWPDAFPDIDESQVQAGRRVFEQYCIACHEDIDRTDPQRLIKVRMSSLEEIQTDPLMAQNAIFKLGKTGIFEGKPYLYKYGAPLGEEARAIYVANNLMVGILTNNPLQSYLAKRDAIKLGLPDVHHPPKYLDGRLVETGQEVSDEALLAYKARPLNGVWSSAPYLHNGSVANMYELLLPAKERMTQFYVGSMEFDPVNMGFNTKQTENAFQFDTSLPGNANTGHEYGAGYDGKPVLTEEQRWALIEYLKTL